MKFQYSAMQPLSQSSSAITHHSANDEIDISQIIILMWKEKLIIFTTILFFLVPTSLWLFTKAPVYAVETVIDSAPSYSINSLQPSKLIGGERYQLAQQDEKILFQKVTNQLETFHVQKLFWENWSKQALSKDQKNPPNQNDVAFDKFARNLKLTKPDPKKTTSTINKLTLETTEPTVGIELLKEYSKFLNNYVAGKAIEQMEEGYNSSLSQLKADYERLTAREYEKLNDQLIQLNEQMELARSLNIIDTPYDKLSGIELRVIDNRLYMLGTKALTGEIKALKMRLEQKPSVFVVELRNMEHWQKTMEDDLKKLQLIRNKLIVFETISPPVQSIEGVGSKKFFIIIGMIFLSLIVAVVIVLVRNAFKNNRT